MKRNLGRVMDVKNVTKYIYIFCLLLFIIFYLLYLYYLLYFLLYSLFFIYSNNNIGFNKS